MDLTSIKNKDQGPGTPLSLLIEPDPIGSALGECRGGCGLTPISRVEHRLRVAHKTAEVSDRPRPIISNEE